MVVSGATAQVRGKRVADLCVGGARVVAQKGSQRHQKARRAEPALQTVSATKCGLKGIQLPRCSGEAFNGPQIVAVRLDREHDARPNRLAVEQDGARPADAMFAADMRAGEPEIVSDEIAQEQARLDRARIADAVDGDFDVDVRRLL